MQSVLQLIINLTAAFNSLQLYAKEHPQTKNYIQKAFIELEKILSERYEVTIILVGNDVVVSNRRLVSQKGHLTKFVSVLRHKNVERITFTTGIDIPDFTRFTMDLASKENQMVESSPNIKVGKVELRVKAKSTDKPKELDDQTQERLHDIGKLRDQSEDEIRSLYEIAKTSKPIHFQNVEKIITAFINGMMQGLNPLGLLSSLKSNDEYTFTHVINVCILTMSQAKALGFKGSELHKIGIASVLHDSGKLFIPEEILNKPEGLTSEERHIIETHTVRGAEYIMGLDGIPKLAVIGALEHHIHFDGTGYPNLGRTWKPNIVSQMITIADMFDAMRSRRVYMEPKPHDLIIKILKEDTGTKLNPLLVKNFLRLIESNPSGE